MLGACIRQELEALQHAFSKLEHELELNKQQEFGAIAFKAVFLYVLYIYIYIIIYLIYQNTDISLISLIYHLIYLTWYVLAGQRTEAIHAAVSP